MDYEIFNTAIDTIVEAYNDCKNKKELQEYIQDNYNDYASVYTYDRLQYLNNSNDSDIAEYIRNYALNDVSTACAIWYSEQVNNAISLILGLYETIR